MRQMVHLRMITDASPMNVFLIVSFSVSLPHCSHVFNNLPFLSIIPLLSLGVGKEQVEIAEELRELLKSAAENPPPKSRSKQVSSLVRPSPSHSPTPPVVTPSHKARNSALQSGLTPERRSPLPREAGKSALSRCGFLLLFEH